MTIFETHFRLNWDFQGERPLEVFLRRYLIQKVFLRLIWDSIDTFTWKDLWRSFWDGTGFRRYFWDSFETQLTLSRGKTFGGLFETVPDSEGIFETHLRLNWDFHVERPLEVFLRWYLIHKVFLRLNCDLIETFIGKDHWRSFWDGTWFRRYFWDSIET